MMANDDRLAAAGNNADCCLRPGPHVLLVEDDHRFAVQLQNRLRDQQTKLYLDGCEVDIASSAEEARAFISRDEIDIYIVDLGIPEVPNSQDSITVGRALIREIDRRVCAGIIVLTSERPEKESVPALEAGADDFISKYPATQDRTTFEDVQARVRAVWRRTQLLRAKNRNQFTHTNRVFMVGDWQFVVGNRELTRAGCNDRVRLSATEHAFLRYICVVDSHQIDSELFSIEVLARGNDKRHPRLDNFIYRIREKLGESVQILSQRGGTYKLLDVKELKPKLA